MQNNINTGKILDRDEKGKIVSGSLNPYGRPKGAKNRYTKLNEIISNYPDEKGLFFDAEETIIKMIIEKAMSGDLEASKIVFERLYGKVPTLKELKENTEIEKQSRVIDEMFKDLIRTDRV